jgi:hypothetical protein
MAVQVPASNDADNDTTQATGNISWLFAVTICGSWATIAVIRWYYRSSDVAGMQEHFVRVVMTYLNECYV